MIGTSYIPFPPWALLFCLTPLFIFWFRETSIKRAFIGGWLTQFILNLIGFHWIAYTSVEFGHFPMIFGIAVLLFFAAFAHLHYPIAGLIFRYVNNRFRLSRIPSVFISVSVFAICDRFSPMIFPWHMGYPWLWAKLPGAQFADVIGFDGLYYCTILINALFAWAVVEGLSYRKFERKPSLIAGSALALFVILNLLGLGRTNQWKQTDSTANFLAVQGNIGNFEKLQAELQRNFGTPIIDTFLRLSRKGLAENPATQIMLWPETAFPDLLDPQYYGTPLAYRTRMFAKEVHIPLLTGGYSRTAGSNAVYNGLFSLDVNGEQNEPPYRKSILLVFGETFPFSEYYDYVEKFFPNQGSFGRGKGPRVLHVGMPGVQKPVVIGPQICYEGLYPWLSASLAKQGAQIFVNVTNDSWFGKDFEPYQHLYMTLARGIEFRRPLVRSTNTGITTAILADGEVLQRSPIGHEWAGAFKIPYLQNPPHTFYEKFGFAWTWVLALMTLLLVVCGRTGSESGTPAPTSGDDTNGRT